ncbi:hypothetical protein FACS189493_3930 [Spirochaetia bacterium]|nr:hypothetical protein FACS189493_3930 [Spirochaetia bacterium]
MKRAFCFFVVLSITVGLCAFDKSLNGSWGLTMDGEQQEFIRFTDNEIIIFGDTLFRSGDFEEADNSIYIELDGSNFLIQYYLLAPNTLLFIMFDGSNTMTFILSKS